MRDETVSFPENGFGKRRYTRLSFITVVKEWCNIGWVRPNHHQKQDRGKGVGWGGKGGRLFDLKKNRRRGVN